MVYKHYYIIVISRVFFIVLTSIVLAYVLYKTNYVYTTAGLIILIILQTVSLIRFLNKTNRYLSNFLYFLKEDNASISYNEAINKSPISDLHAYFNEIRDIIKHVRIEKENQYMYLQYIIDNIGIGLISFDEKGKIELINESARILLGIPVMHNINDLNRIQIGFSSFVMDLKPGQPQLYKLNLEGEIVHLSVKGSKIKIGERNICIISFQDIKNELDDNELDSYQKLIRVLTHEIMNSVTPINTLTGAIKKFYRDQNGIRDIDDINNDIIEETVTGLDLIEERGHGLKTFVNKYRSLTKLPQPQFKKVDVQILLNKMIKLLQNDLDERNIYVEIEIHTENLMIHADEKMLEQVIINLIKNAINAIPVNQEGRISLTARKTNDLRTFIHISDNGIGITKENINHIFTPFFTTKEQGSGIGLSLARQIMRLHKGYITVKSEPGKGSTFTLEF